MVGTSCNSSLHSAQMTKIMATAASCLGTTLPTTTPWLATATFTAFNNSQDSWLSEAMSSQAAAQLRLPLLMMANANMRALSSVIESRRRPYLVRMKNWRTLRRLSEGQRVQMLTAVNVWIYSQINNCRSC